MLHRRLNLLGHKPNTFSSFDRHRRSWADAARLLVISIIGSVLIQPGAFATGDSLVLASDQVSYVEQAEPVAIAPSVTFAATSFGAGHIRVELPSSTSTEILTLSSVATLAETQTTSGVITVFASEIYVGKGAGVAAEKIGSVSPAENGVGGNALRVNFIASAFENSDFESGGSVNDIDGWTVLQSRVITGVTQIEGVTTENLGPRDQHVCVSSVPSIDDDFTFGAGVEPSFSGTDVVDTLVAERANQGLKNLRLKVSITNNTSAVYIIRGPVAYSDPFTIAAGQEISFDWRAVGQSDRGIAYGALLKVSGNGPTWVRLLDEVTGQNQGLPWSTVTETVPDAGTYRFVFIAGGYNADCLSATTGELYIDNVTVKSNVSNDSIRQVIEAIRYANSADNPPASRIVNLVGQPQTGTAITPANPIQINITQVDDPPSPPTNLTHTFVNSLATGETFASQSGTLNATDPDGDSIEYGITGGTASAETVAGVTYDISKSDTLGTLLVESSTGKYLFLPDDNAIDQSLVPASNVFEFSASASGVVVTSSYTITAAYDMKLGAPSLSSVVVLSDTNSKEITYELTFDEFVDDFTSADITLLGSSGTAGSWSITEPTQIGSNPVYQFTVSNAAAINGTVSFSLDVMGIQDYAVPPNDLSSGTPTGVDESEVLISRPLSFTLGTPGKFFGDPVSISPNITLEANGESPVGARLSITSGDDWDQLSFTNSNSTLFGDITATFSYPTLEMTSSGTATVAQFQNALRNVVLSNTTASPSLGARTVDVHIKPTNDYSYDTGHFYSFVADPGTVSQVAADNLASGTFRYGVFGYLTTVASATESNHVATVAGAGKTFWLGKELAGASLRFTAGPENGGSATYQNFDTPPSQPAQSVSGVVMNSAGSWSAEPTQSPQVGWEPNGTMIEFGNQFAGNLGWTFSQELEFEAVVSIQETPGAQQPWYPSAAPASGFNILGPQTRAALSAEGILAAPSGVTELNANLNIAALSSGAALTVTTSRTISTGEALRVSLNVDSSYLTGYDLISYIKLDSGDWYPLGRASISSTTIQSERLLFAKPGDFTLKFSVIADSSSISEQLVLLNTRQNNFLTNLLSITSPLVTGLQTSVLELTVTGQAVQIGAPQPPPPVFVSPPVFVPPSTESPAVSESQEVPVDLEERQPPQELPELTETEVESAPPLQSQAPQSDDLVSPETENAPSDVSEELPFVQTPDVIEPEELPSEDDLLVLAVPDIEPTPNIWTPLVILGILALIASVTLFSSRLFR